MEVLGMEYGSTSYLLTVVAISLVIMAAIILNQIASGSFILKD